MFFSLSCLRGLFFDWLHCPVHKIDDFLSSFQDDEIADDETIERPPPLRDLDTSSIGPANTRNNNNNNHSSVSYSSSDSSSVQPASRAVRVPGGGNNNNVSMNVSASQGRNNNRNNEREDFDEFDF